MTLEKAPKQTERVNVVMLKSVQEIAAGLMKARLKGDNFSELLRDLIVEEHKRPEASAKAELEWLNRAFREAVAETGKLKEEVLKLTAKLEERAERFKLERKGLQEALDLCEEDLKKARSQGA